MGIPPQNTDRFRAAQTRYFCSRSGPLVLIVSINRHTHRGGDESAHYQGQKGGKKKLHPGTRDSSRKTSHGNITVQRAQEINVVVFRYKASARGWTTFASAIRSNTKKYIRSTAQGRAMSDPYYARVRVRGG